MMDRPLLTKWMDRIPHILVIGGIAALVLILLAVEFGSSKKPKVGDWFEEIGNKERVKVEAVGKGFDLKHRMQTIADSINRVGLGHYLGAEVIFDDEDGTRDCFTYTKLISNGRVDVWVFHIKPIEVLKEDYVSVKRD